MEIGHTRPSYRHVPPVNASVPRATMVVALIMLSIAVIPDRIWCC